MKNRGKVKILAGLLALTLVAGTFAYFSKEMSIHNPFSTKKYGGETIEKFTPEYEWEPGGEVTKEVQAKNTGDYPLYVRVKFSEKWERNQTEIETFDSVDQYQLFFPENADKKVTNGSSVYKNLIGTSGSAPTWKDGGDGYYYYMTVLNPKESTSKLLDSVTLCKDADMGNYVQSNVKYAVVDASKTAEELTDADYTLNAPPAEIEAGKVLYQKVMVELDSKNAGLAGANYTLTITTELLQANEDAAAGAGWSYTPQ